AYAGNGLVDSEMDWEVDDDNGNPVIGKLKIRGVYQSSEYDDVFFTDLAVKIGPGPWESFCKDAYDNDVEAIAIPGYFNPADASWHDDSSAIAFACRGTAAGKCVEWGYRMWATHGGASLADYYRACTRMVRADYCGNGVSHTVNGNPIDVSDAAGVQTPETNWPVEAKWGPDGAVCLNTPRRQAWSREVVIAECQAAGRGTIPTCTNNDPSEYGGLVMTQANAL
ncbi:MAG TPA: ADYC domain-containing protein, partial [Nannocystis sp.]